MLGPQDLEVAVKKHMLTTLSARRLVLGYVEFSGNAWEANSMGPSSMTTIAWKTLEKEEVEVGFGSLGGMICGLWVKTVIEYLKLQQSVTSNMGGPETDGPRLSRNCVANDDNDCGERKHLLHFLNWHTLYVVLTEQKNYRKKIASCPPNLYIFGHSWTHVRGSNGAHHFQGPKSGPWINIWPQSTTHTARSVPLLGLF